MARSQISNQLLGRYCTPTDQSVWEALGSKPNLNGIYDGVIEAVWLDGSEVMLLVRDQHGTLMPMQSKWVRVGSLSSGYL